MVKSLIDLYPGSRHVREAGLQEAPDAAVWEFAKGEGFVIVSKDSDFRQKSFLSGHPPKVICLKAGNVPTSAIEALLRANHDAIVKFEKDPESAFLVLGGGA